jgi:hypothetical protein
MYVSTQLCMASPGTQVTLGTEIFVISFCYSLLLAMYMDIALIGKTEN